MFTGRTTQGLAALISDFAAWKPLKPVYWHDVSELARLRAKLGCSPRVGTQWQRFCKAALSVLISRFFSSFFFEVKLYQQGCSHVGRRWGCTGACRLTRVKRLVSGFKLHSGCLLTRWTLCLRGPASYWAKVNTPKLLSKHFKGSPKLQNEKAPFSTCCSRCLLSGDEML